MSTFIRSSIAITIALMLTPLATSAQSISDGVRLATELIPTNSRNEAMGGNLISAADGYSALDANPAALAPLAQKEFALSLYNRSYNSTAMFLGNSAQASLSNLALSSLGLAYPYPTVQGHLAVAVSYDRVRDYHATYGFKGVNPNSSLFNTKDFVLDPGIIAGSAGNHQYLVDNNLAYALYLTNDVNDTGAVTLVSPYTGGLQQSGTVTAEGHLDAVRVGAGVDIAEGVSAGATLNLFFGTYDYNRDYNETDVAGIYSAKGFQSANIIDAIHEDQSGASLKLGLLVNKFDLVRFGLTVETPQVIHVVRTFDRTGTSDFSGGHVYSSSNMADQHGWVDEYNLVSPMRLGAGASLHLLDATASASISYTDMTQIRFENADVPVDDLNQSARTLLRSVLSIHVGGEYVIPVIGLSLRAGFAIEPSPFAGDPSTFDTKTLSGGLGLLLSKSVLLEASIRHTTYHTLHTIYNDFTLSGTPVSANVDDDAVKRDDIAVSFNYRF